MSEDARSLAETEARLLTSLQNEYILHAVKAFQENETLCIVTEFCDQGDLAEFLEERKGESLDEERIVEWFRQICSALEVNALFPFLLLPLIYLVSDTFIHSLFNYMYFTLVGLTTNQTL